MPRKKGFVANTVKGKRRGSKWPQAVKTACLCDMLIEPNLHRIAHNRGVPESTLRGWYNREMGKMSAAQRESLWEQARRAKMQEIAHRAAAGAARGVEMINSRLELAETEAKRAVEIEDMLLAAKSGGEDAPLLHPAAAERLEEELKTRKERGVGDYPLANFTRTLVQVGEKAARVEGEDEAARGLDVTIQVVE